MEARFLLGVSLSISLTRAAVSAAKHSPMTMAAAAPFYTTWKAHPFVLTSILIILTLVCYEMFRSKMPFELRAQTPDLPIVGCKKGEWFGRWRALWRNTVNIKEALNVAYQWKDQACVVPTIDLGDVVTLPVSETQWFLDRGDDEVSTQYQLLDIFQLQCSIADFKMVEDSIPIHQILISDSLTQQTNKLLPVLAEEAAAGVDAILGMDSEDTRKICLMDHLPALVGRVANRVFVGPKLCTNEDLVMSATRLAEGVGITSLFLRCSPRLTRPLLNGLITRPQKRATRQFFRVVEPEVSRRLNERLGITSVFPPNRKPNDFLQWLLEAAVQDGSPYMMDPKTIMGRLLLINLVSIHISSTVLAHVLFDLASNSRTYVDELRTEIVASLTKHAGRWSKQSLADMPKLDSTFRESQRLNSISTLSSPRPVCKREGITTPSGVHLPYSTPVALLSYPVLHDPDIYPDPETFHPFRFAAKREEVAGLGWIIDNTRQSWTSATKTYTAFGAANNPCPGRFFAANALKVTLAYILLNYDIERLAERPKNAMFIVTTLPSFEATLGFKRRKGSLFKIASDDFE